MKSDPKRMRSLAEHNNRVSFARQWMKDHDWLRDDDHVDEYHVASLLRWWEKLRCFEDEEPRDADTEET